MFDFLGDSAILHIPAACFGQLHLPQTVAGPQRAQMHASRASAVLLAGLGLIEHRPGLRLRRGSSDYG